MDENFGILIYNSESSSSDKGSAIVDDPENENYQIRRHELDPDYDCNRPNENVDSSEGDHNANKSFTDIWFGLQKI